MWNTLFPHSQFDTPLFNGNELPFLMKRPATNLGQTVENLLLMRGTGTPLPQVGTHTPVWGRAPKRRRRSVGAAPKEHFALFV